ncbi:hypothetical protein [Sphingomonas colocasiae]|uniref:AI-2E family transporter n=1 Tax=Sphingomonas colocasiae TaxID=1848973 RepID=A0ABS7PXX6_9SPHN|nr:hypothetical protein [Sphingomonas colocasiae]MBY8826192.1 hypothetical protein [Sphingomonas colocasiae]
MARKKVQYRAMDGPITGLLEDAIRLVEDRYGRAAAWIVAIVGSGLALTIPLAIMLYLLR